MKTRFGKLIVALMSDLNNFKIADLMYNFWEKKGLN